MGSDGKEKLSVHNSNAINKGSYDPSFQIIRYRSPGGS